jgi:thiol-disulfide isomerase/thioredoxin
MLRLVRISSQMSTSVPFPKFEEVFNSLLANNTKAVVLFTSDKNEDGVEWCPDCVAVKPLYPTIEEEAKKVGLPLFIFYCGDRPTWKNPENKFRRNKLVQLTSVPTLGLFDGKKVTRKLMEGDLLSQAQRSMVYE